MAALLLFPIAAALTPPVRVWDGVFAQPDLSIIATSGERRQHSFTSVFDRHAFPKGRTVLERSLASILDALDDSSQYIEYWWREEWKSIEAHRDVDETLCLSRKHAGSPLGVQRCPNNGHVLYVDVEDDVRGPTCVWVEEPPPDDFKLAATAEEADGRAGPPRELQSMVVVPCRAGRLLRFSGEAIHAVPRPSCEWLKDDDDAEQDGKAVAAAQQEDDDDEKRVGGVIPLGPPPTLPSKRRAVVLFNTWNVPPLVPSANDPPPPKAIDELESLVVPPPTCEPVSTWSEVGVTSSRTAEVEEEEAMVEAPLLGNVQRSCSESGTLVTSATSAAAARAALLSPSDVHILPLIDRSERTVLVRGGGSDPQDATASDSGEDVEVSAAEEAAVKVGYLDYLEDEFFGELDDGEWEDEDEEEEDDDELPSAFLEQLAKLKAREEERKDRSKGPGVGNEI